MFALKANPKHVVSSELLCSIVVIHRVRFRHIGIQTE